MPDTRDEGSCSETGKHAHLIRLLFALPSYLPLPDGCATSYRYPHPAGEAEPWTPFAQVQIHQVQLDSENGMADVRAANAALQRILEFSGNAGSSEPAAAPPELIGTWHTVADVITTEDSPDGPASTWDGRPQNLGPRQDAVMRAVDSTNRIARAVRLAGQNRVIVPTYERMPPLVMWLSAVAPYVDGLLGLPADSAWTLRGVMRLEHTNIQGAEVTDLQEQQRLQQESTFWDRCLDAGSPAPLAREHLLEAQHLHHHQGEYAKAVIVAATAVEVMCDSVLSALLWEEHWVDAAAPGTDEIASWFEEGTASRRATMHLLPRLKGDWASANSPWQLWRSKGSGLRNRIVHAGYQPERAEAQEVLDNVDILQSFIFDRLSAQAAKYPRVTLMLVTRAGLESRGLYRGKVKRFDENRATAEPSWLEQFGPWHQRLIKTAND
jgi:hypothetical protein